MLEISRDDVLQRIAWLRWQGLDEQAFAVVQLCAWMTPAFRPEDFEADIRRRIAALADNNRTIHDPVHWD